MTEHHTVLLSELTHLPQIFQPTDPITEEKALKTTQVLIQTIYSTSESSDDKAIEGLAKDACDECMQILREPEKSQAKHAIKVLCAFMSTTREFDSCTYSVKPLTLPADSFRCTVHARASRSTLRPALPKPRRAAQSCSDSPAARGSHRSRSGVDCVC